MSFTNPYRAQWPLGPDRFSAYARRVIHESVGLEFREPPCNEYIEKQRDEQHSLSHYAHNIAEVKYESQ